MITYYLAISTSDSSLRFWVGYLTPDFVLYWNGWQNSRGSFVYSNAFVSIHEFINRHSDASIYLHEISEELAIGLAHLPESAVQHYISNNYPEYLL